MSGATAVAVRELAAWGLDDYRFRPAGVEPCDQAILNERPAYLVPEDGIAFKSEATEGMMRSHADREDLQFEMKGLMWSMEVIDLTGLLSFQRRLSFDPDVALPQMPELGDLSGLVDLAFSPPKTVEYKAMSLNVAGHVVVRSRDPNVQMRLSPADGQIASVYAGSPFLEVALFRNRWFLRDGYHRAYRLLLAGFRYVPAIVVRATTPKELGATQPWFFAEETLFSDRPPRVTDFLDDRLTLQYTRPPLIKTLRLTVEQSLQTEEEFQREITDEHCNQTR